MRPRLHALLSDVLQRDDLPPFEECSVDLINEWDSIAHLNLILSVEGDFGVTFSIDKVVELNSLEAFEATLIEIGVR
jgi:acyl carrier protein